MKNKAMLLLKTGLVIVGVILMDLLFFQLSYLSVTLTLLLSFVLIILYKNNHALLTLSSASDVEGRNGLNVNNNEKEIKITLTKIVSLLSQQIAIVDTEVDRASILIQEATTGIADSFKSLKSLTDEQQVMLNAAIGNHRGAVDENGTTIESFVHDSSETLDDFLQVIMTTSKQSL
ncbi:MAG: methyl-accepting chemotaxis protein, partial [Colwellia sp.]